MTMMVENVPILCAILNMPILTALIRCVMCINIIINAHRYLKVFIKKFIIIFYIVSLVYYKLLNYNNLYMYISI